MEQIPEIRRQLLFYPNDSLYRIGGKYRLVAYHYRKSQRQHEIVSLEIDEPLEQLLEAAQDGATIDALAGLFTDEELRVRMQELLALKKLVRHVVVPDADNELYLDLEGSPCRRLLLELIGKRKGIMLEEFLFTAENAVVRQGGNAYTNEFQFVFHQ